MVLDIIHKSKKRILLVSAMSALAGAANIRLLVLVNRAAHSTVTELGAVAEFAGTLLLMTSISLASQILLSRLSAGTFFRLRKQLVHGITRLSCQKMEEIGHHRLYAALAEDVPAVHALIINLPNYVFNFTVALACLIYLAIVSVKLFLALAALLLVALAVAKFAIADRAEKRLEARRQIEDELFKCYGAIIDGSKELKLNRWRKDLFVDRELQEPAEKYRDATMAAELLWNMSNNWATASIFAGLGVLLFLSSSYPAIAGSAGRQGATTFVMVVFYMFGPLTILMNSFRTIHAAKVGFQQLASLQLDTTEQPQAGPPEAVEPFRSMSVRDLSFNYDNSSEAGREDFSVGPLDLEISRGEIIYLVGGNGSGKTTAAKLLTGLYGKRAGSVLINGVEINDLETYFQYFSAIFQDYYLFETVVHKHSERVDPQEVQAWLKKLKLAENVAVENGRLSTTKLSYGQRKRLALLVAYFDQSYIYVFDEWAADQDQEFREFFYREFLPGLKQQGKTMLVVTHDERYFHLADQVVKFEGGAIVSIVHNAAAHELPIEAGALLG